MSLTYAEWLWAQQNTGHYGWDKNTPLSPSGMPWDSDPFSKAANDQYQQKWSGTGQANQYLHPTQYPVPNALNQADYKGPFDYNEWLPQGQTAQPTPQPAPTAQAPVTSQPTSPAAPVGLTSTPNITGAPAPYQRPDAPAFAGSSTGTHTARSSAPAPYQRPEFTPTPAPEFKGTMPAPQLMSLEEMMDVVGKRANLAYDSRIEAKGRGLEEEMLKGEQTKGAIQESYGKALEDLHKAGQGYQRSAASTMRKRGIYDSGLAVNTSNQIHLAMLQGGLQVSSEEARQLSELAEYLALRERHTNQEIQEMMGEKALFAETMLDEMHQRNQDRGDMLAQREFENWLAQAHFGAQHEQMQRQEYWTQVGFDAKQMEQEYTRFWNDKMFEWQQYESQLNEYWRQTTFDASMAQQEYQRFWDQASFEWDKYTWENSFDAQQAQFEHQKYMDQANMEWQQHRAEQEDYWRQVGFDADQQQLEYQKFMDQKEMEWRNSMAERDDYRWGAEFDAKQSEAAWARIDSMNRWEAEMELAKLQYNNQITQQEFNNAMALNDLELKKALHKAQYG
jgi:hypothetical protein